ncbi:MAG: ATP-binding protein, partial [Planctomycetes bacterium]|nr:ATP-binding protein [Planctomycetota bacterium]
HRQIIMLDMDEPIYLAQNPWKAGGIPAPPALARAAAGPLEADLERPEILILLGARQTGKTTLLREMARRILVAGHIRPDLLHYLDLDTMRCEDVLATNRSLIDFLRLAPGDRSAPRRIVLIDEVQRLENPGLFLKSVHDLELPLKLLVTGSSSLEIRSRVRESLAGRSIRHQLWPLSPHECRGTPHEPIASYLAWGGFPAVVLAGNDADRQLVLANLLASYMDRDIVDFLRVENAAAFSSFLKLLAGQIGQLVNLNEMANTIGVSRDTLARHLGYLEGTFMVRLLRPFAGNRRTELTKMPKIYFADLGLRNLLAGRLSVPLTPSDRGPLFENLVEIILRQDPRTEDLSFWRTRAGAEVDFIWHARGELHAIEVKSSPLAQPRVPRSLASFIKTYDPRRAAVVAPGAEGEVLSNGTKVLFLPPERVAAVAD